MGYMHMRRHIQHKHNSGVHCTVITSSPPLRQIIVSESCSWVMCLCLTAMRWDLRHCRWSDGALAVYFQLAEGCTTTSVSVPALVGTVTGILWIHISSRTTLEYANADAVGRLPLPNLPEETSVPPELVLMVEAMNSSPVLAVQIATRLSQELFFTPARVGQRKWILTCYHIGGAKTSWQCMKDAMWIILVLWKGRCHW